jgi:hypothetical protein
MTFIDDEAVHCDKHAVFSYVLGVGFDLRAGSIASGGFGRTDAASSSPASLTQPGRWTAWDEVEGKTVSGNDASDYLRNSIGMTKRVRAPEGGLGKGAARLICASAALSTRALPELLDTATRTA